MIDLEQIAGNEGSSMAAAGPAMDHDASRARSWVIEASYEARLRPLLDRTPTRVLLALGLGVGVSVLLVVNGVASPVVLRIAGIVAGHGALLATALAWADEAPARRAPGRLAIGALAAAATLGALVPGGVLAYGAVPVTVWLLASRGGVARLGLGCSVPPRALGLGVVVGLFLGAHVLLSATRTLGYQARVDSLATLGSALAYDVGANVLAAECFFRGALFDRLVRRWSFGSAAAVATGACVLRYVVDPLLPKTPELIAGAVFYIGLQSLASCWLFWWSGSLIPGFVAGVLFFSAYRLLAG